MCADDDEETKFEKRQMWKADEQDKIREESNKQLLEDVIDKKKQGDIFKKKVGEYNKPMIFSIFGFLLSLMIGLVYPVFGALMIKCIFGLLSADPVKNALDDIGVFVMWMAIMSFGLIFAVSGRAIFFGYIGENITMNMRKNLYESVMRKHMGWHDDRRHNSGVVTSLLSGECSHL